MTDIEIFKQMKNEGVDIGAKVDILLKRNVHFNIQTTTVPTYHLARDGGLPSEPSERSFTGYVAEIDERTVGIVPGWDHEKNCNAESGYIGGVRIDLDAIDTYEVLADAGINPHR